MASLIQVFSGMPMLRAMPAALLTEGIRRHLSRSHRLAGVMPSSLANSFWVISSHFLWDHNTQPNVSDDWIEDETLIGQKMDEFIEARKKVNGFDIRYNANLDATELASHYVQPWDNQAAYLITSNSAALSTFPTIASTRSNTASSSKYSLHPTH
jgi:hypothetical protein